MTNKWCDRRITVQVSEQYYVFLIDSMSELVWGIKNGDLDQVKDIVEQKVNMLRCSLSGALKV
jgi:hypothetical protein